MNTNTISAETVAYIVKGGHYTQCKRSNFPWHKAPSRSHKYFVKTVTTPLVGPETEKRVSSFYTDSIAHLEFTIEQMSDYMRKDYDGMYTAIHGAYITAYYVDRVY